MKKSNTKNVIFEKKKIAIQIKKTQARIYLSITAKKI